MANLTQEKSISKLSKYPGGERSEGAAPPLLEAAHTSSATERSEARVHFATGKMHYAAVFI